MKFCMYKHLIVLFEYDQILRFFENIWALSCANSQNISKFVHNNIRLGLEH